MKGKEKYFSGNGKQDLLNYIDAIVRKNQKETGEEIGKSSRSVRRLKKKFGKMSRKERLALIHNLTGEEE